jgi:hypothetical protein
MSRDRFNFAVIFLPNQRARHAMQVTQLDTHQRRRKRFTWLTLGVILVLLALLLLQMSQSGRLVNADFVQYWAAGRLNLSGDNPYSPEYLLPLQLSAGLPGGIPIMMWNPPWTLAIAMPFALLPYAWAQIAWLVVGLAILLFSAHWLWGYFSGPRPRRWVSLVVLATFLPGLFALRMGQISPLLLLGLVGFLYFERQDRGWQAGLCASLLAIKPHLLYLFWMALLLWAIRRRAWSYPLGVAAAILLATAVALLANPSALQQYLYASSTYPPIGWKTPTLGGLLRYVFDSRHLWLQFAPAAVGTLWFLSYWGRQRQSWRWSAQISLLTTVSLTTAAYGWDYDLILLLVPVVQVGAVVAAKPWDLKASAIVSGYLLINVLALGLNIMQVGAFWFFWMAPAYLLWYLVAQQLLAASFHEQPVRR